MTRRAPRERIRRATEPTAHVPLFPARSTLANPSSGAALDSTIASRLGATLGHDFSTLRVHDDRYADALAREMDARALTSGSHVYFRAGEYVPETTEGLRVLTHEATHVVQQAAGQVHATPDGLGIAENADQQHEESADAAAIAALNGVAPLAGALPPMGTQGPPGAVVQRWPWSDDDEKPDAASAPSVWDSIKSAGSTALDYGNAAGSAVMSAESAAWGGTKSAASAASGAYNSVAPDFTKSNKDLGSVVDMGEAAAKKGNAQLVSQYGDIPVLGSLVKGSAWMGDLTTDATGGVLKGVGDLASMAGNAIFHPIDALGGMAEGALGAAEHVPLIPGLNTTVKGLHGLYDLATGKPNAEYGSSLGALGENLLLGTHTDPNDPSKKSNADVDFAAGIGGGTKVWREKPAEAATRTITNLLPMLLGDELAGGNQPAVGGGPVPEVVPGAPPAVEPFGGVGPVAGEGIVPGEATSGSGALAGEAAGGDAAAAGARPRYNVQILKNIAKSGVGNVEMWENMLQKGATSVAEGGSSVAGSLADMLSPAAESIPTPTPKLPTTVDMPAVSAPDVNPFGPTSEMPQVPTGETGSFGMKGKTLPPFNPNAPAMEQLAWGLKTFEPGQINFPNPVPSPLPQTVFDHLPFGAAPPPTPPPFGKRIPPGVSYGDFGLPVGPDGSLDLSKLLKESGGG